MSLSNNAATELAFFSFPIFDGGAASVGRPIVNNL